jgi:Holliday junction DNA helicase RuvA
MISHITGAVLESGPGFVIIETAGIGYKVSVTAETLAELAQKSVRSVSLWTHLAVRDDGWELYGFRTKNELQFFNLLISISGIGPKTALGVLNASSIENLKTAIGTGEISYLTKISGIGRKLAGKIVFELKEKIGGDETADGGAMKGDADVLEALTALGYNERDAREAVKKLPKEITGAGNRIKSALKNLAK